MYVVLDQICHCATVFIFAADNFSNDLLLMQDYVNFDNNELFFLGFLFPCSFSALFEYIIIYLIPNIQYHYFLIQTFYQVLSSDVVGRRAFR
jgi:hypothetical protein